MVMAPEIEIIRTQKIGKVTSNETLTAAASHQTLEIVPHPHVLEGERHPALVKAWDNDVDDIYDTL